MFDRLDSELTSCVTEVRVYESDISTELASSAALNHRRLFASAHCVPFCLRRSYRLEPSLEVAYAGLLEDRYA